jgi:hypothetical protein
MQQPTTVLAVGAEELKTRDKQNPNFLPLINLRLHNGPTPATQNLHDVGQITNHVVLAEASARVTRPKQLQGWNLLNTFRPLHSHDYCTV